VQVEELGVQLRHFLRLAVHFFLCLLQLIFDMSAPGGFAIDEAKSVAHHVGEGSVVEDVPPQVLFTNPPLSYPLHTSTKNKCDHVTGLK
jgi:hypothetical protein